MAITLAFQAKDTGPIPVTRSHFAKASRDTSHWMSLSIA